MCMMPINQQNETLLHEGDQRESGSFFNKLMDLASFCAIVSQVCTLR